MCDGCAPAGGWTRRRFLVGVAAGATVAAVPFVSVPARAGTAVEVLARAAWAGDDRPAGPLPPEPDVRFLVVHHTVNGNDYAADDVVAMLRGIHSFHTGPEKGWPDLAYNFIVDRFGRIWETRAGSLAALGGDVAVAGDATGGNQGVDQKCAFLGDHRVVPPSTAAREAMVGLLAALADRYAIDTAPGATATFVSRGSNRHPTGTEVTTATITGHRTMSRTTCPGDAAMVLVADEIPRAVTALRSQATTTTTTSTPLVVTSSSSSSSSSAPRSIPSLPPGPPDADGPADGDASPTAAVVAAGAAIAVVAGALVRWRTR